MKQDNQIIKRWLESRCARKRLAHWLAFCLFCGALLQFFLLVFWGLEALGAPITEETAKYFFGGLAFLSLFSFIFCFWKIRKLFPLKHYIREFSREHPEDHDALEATVELESKSRTELRPFEQEYLVQLHARYSANNFELLRTSHAFARPRWWPHIFASGILVLLFLFVPNPVQRRAWQGWTNRLPSIEFVDLPAEIERHQDLPVTVRINRHGGSATLEVSEQDAAPVRHQMQGTGATQHLMLYDISNRMRIRAFTPWTGTRWHRVTVYDPPAPERISIDTTPPAYTGRTPQHRDDFGDLELIAGETLHIECEMPEGQTCQLRELSADTATPVPCTLTPLPSQEMHIQAEYRDGARHTAKGPAFTVTVRPDLAPAIELIEPTADATCKPGESPNVLANVTDDFGVTAVEAHFYLDNQPEAKQLLWSPEANGTIPRQQEVVSRLPLNDLQLVPGQLLTGWLEATDNRTPDTQRARSELFFITIVPDETAFEANMEGMDGGEMHEISITDLIVESKRLLRNTFDLSSLEFEPPVAQRLRSELERDLRALELAIRARSIDLAQQLGMPQLPPELQQFFNEAAAQLVQAATDVTAGALADSRGPQQSALVTLVQLNNILMENMMKMSSSGEGEGESQPGEEPDEEGEKQASSQPQTATADRQQEIAQLEAAREELRKILQEQRAILDDLRRANRLASSYVEPERLLSRRTQSVAGRLAGIAEAEPIQTPLRNAATELDNSGQDFAIPGNQSTATIHARRAEKNLQDGLTLLEQLLRQLTSQQVEKLSEDAKKLADRQRELSRTSQRFSESPPDDDTRKGAREAQEELSKATGELRQRIDQTARSMERDNPQAAKQLRATMDTEDTTALQRAQTRARNALTYRRYETAADEQETAANELEQLAGRLEEAAAQTGLSPEQLQQALEELQRLADETATEQSAEELAQLAHEAADLASQAGRQLGNDALQKIGNELTEAADSGMTPELLRSHSLERIERTREELRQELARIMENAIRRPAPPTTIPPRQYRQEVEEYFRRLGE